MTDSTYSKLCTQVYELSKPVPPEDAYAFYRSYAHSTNGLILEPMCGTGRFLIPLIEDGIDVHGLDISAQMLGVLEKKAIAQKLTPQVWQGGIESLNRTDKYGLIFIPAGSFGLITEPAQISHSLKVLFEHLSDGGILLFEVETSLSVPSPTSVWRGSVWHPTDSHQKILASFFSTVEHDICTAIGRYELLENNQIIQTEIEEYKVKLYDDTSTLNELLCEAGFSSIRMVKAFDKTQQPNKDDAVKIFECIK